MFEIARAEFVYGMQALGWKLRDVFWRWAQRFAGSDPRRDIARCADLCWFFVGRRADVWYSTCNQLAFDFCGKSRRKT